MLVTETTQAGRTTSHHGVTNDSQLILTDLQPFTGYVFAVSFLNSDFEGPTTTVNFTTDEDGLCSQKLID